MKVAMEILTGALFYIQVGNDAKVADLKREIASQQKLPSDRLFFLLLEDDQSRMMSQDQDEVSLVDCGITDGSHIYLFFKPLEHDGSNIQPLVRPLPDSHFE